MYFNLYLITLTSINIYLDCHKLLLCKVVHNWRRRPFFTLTDRHDWKRRGSIEKSVSSFLKAVGLTFTGNECIFHIINKCMVKKLFLAGCTANERQKRLKWQWHCSDCSALPLAAAAALPGTGNSVASWHRRIAWQIHANQREFSTFPPKYNIHSWSQDKRQGLDTLNR